MYGHSRNQTGIMLASKALEEQGNRAVLANCSEGKKTIEAGALLFFPVSNTVLKEQRVSLIPVVNC